MNRRNRLALLGAAALVLALSGSVLAIRAPAAPTAPAQLAQDEDETPPTAEEIALAAERLRAKNFQVTDPLFNELVTQYGVGGAVRVVAWAAGNPANKTMDEIRLMRDGDGTEGSAMGWGRIAKSLDVHPGIGSIMGNGGGHGRANAPGQQNKGTDAGAEGG